MLPGALVLCWQAAAVYMRAGSSGCWQLLYRLQSGAWVGAGITVPAWRDAAQQCYS